MATTRHDLSRTFGLSTTTYVVIASMVGIGILTTSGYVIKDTGSHTLMLVLWLVGGGLALCGALSVAELAAAMPAAGGEYVFMREAYGRPWAFLYGWVSFFIGFAAPIAIVAHGAARYLIEPWVDAGTGGVTLLTRGLAAAFILALTFIHTRGQAPASRLQSITTILKLAVLLAIMVGGLALRRGRFEHLTPDLPAADVPWQVLGISLVYIMFSYSGWNAATYLAGEVKSATRILPRALVLGCGAVVLLYLLLNTVYVYALSTEAVTALSYDQVEPIAALAAERLFGPWVAAPLSVAIGLGLLATLSAFIFTGPRVYFAMARDGLFPRAAGRLNPNTGTPNVAILVQSACALVLLVSGTFHNILTYAGVGLSISSFFVVLAVFVLRVRRPVMPRPFRTPGYPIVPLLFLVCTLWMIRFAFLDQPRWSRISLATILSGIPVYFLWQAAMRRRT